LPNQTASETLIPDPSVSYPFPAIAYDDSASSWTLTQNSADAADGPYKGLFTLALTTGCAKLTVVSHNVVTPDDAIPARYQVCGAPSFTNVAAITTLNGKDITKLEVRSKQPFTVTTQV